MEKILFLCAGNRFRSQMAETFFNHMAKKQNLPYKAESAALLRDRDWVHNHTIKAMREKDFDLSQKKPKRATKEMIDSSNLIILMNSNLSKDFMKLSDKPFEVWNIPDVQAPNNEEEKYPEFVNVRNMVEDKIEKLIISLKN